MVKYRHQSLIQRTSWYTNSKCKGLVDGNTRVKPIRTKAPMVPFYWYAEQAENDFCPHGTDICALKLTNNFT